MKNKFYLLLMSLFIFSTMTFAQKSRNEALITIGDHEISKEEFVRIYKKNNKNTVDQKSLDEYLDLFINFKLKVIEAESLGMDTLYSFKKELNGYRRQLTKKYFTNEEAEEQLYLEAYERSKKAVLCQHILVRVAPYASPEDSMAAYNKIMMARQKILKGEDFETVAVEMSEDPNVQYHRGTLGYKTTFVFPYNLENTIYNQEIGEISMPIRTEIGYNLITVKEKIDVPYQYKVAHIAVRAPLNSSEEMLQKANSWINDLADSIKNGSSFEHIAKVYSEDKQSAYNGGALPLSKPGMFVHDFEKVCFDLKEVGDISEPIKTYFGYHLIKLLEVKPHPSYEDSKEEISKAVKKDALRQEYLESKNYNELSSQYKIKEYVQNLEDFVPLVDTLTFGGIWLKKKGQGLSKPLVKIEDMSFSQADFNEFLTLNVRKHDFMPKDMYIAEYFKKFKRDCLYKFEDSKLEEKDSDFKNLMQEYHDGILLFELTDQMVWSKAVKDTAGLEEFFENNRKNYLWEKRLEADIYSCVTKKVAEEAQALAQKQIKKTYNSQKIIEKVCGSDTLGARKCIRITEGLFTEDDNKMVIKMKWEVGVSEIKELAGQFLFIVVEKIREPEEKNLDEARGLVTADYQNYLEKQWIDELRNKYTIKVNDKLFSTIK